MCPEVAADLSKPEKMFFGEFASNVGEGAIELGVYLAAMIMVERAYGPEGLGLFSYLLSIFHLTAYFSDWGVSRYIERQIALRKASEENWDDVRIDGYQAVVFMGLAVGGALSLLSVYGAGITRIEERLIVYVIIGLSIPLYNLNRLGISILHGNGRHTTAAYLETRKNVIFLGCVFAVMITGARPSYFVLSFLASEFIYLVSSLPTVPLPDLGKMFMGRRRFRETLRQGYRVLFTDRTFGAVMYIDFFVLGLFVPAWELGVYAKVSIMARLLLLIPLSTTSIFREKYCSLVARADFRNLVNLFHAVTRRFFYLQSFLALVALIYFPALLGTFFSPRGEEIESFRIFTIIIPGLIFYASVAASEPLYEALNKVDTLRRVVVTVFAVDLVLNFYLIPYAGFIGAAAATAVSMFLYFLLFSSGMDKRYRLLLLPYLLAGASVYLCYVLAREIDAGILITVPFLAVLIFILFGLSGLHDIGGRQKRMTAG